MGSAIPLISYTEIFLGAVLSCIIELGPVLHIQILTPIRLLTALLSHSEIALSIISTQMITNPILMDNLTKQLHVKQEQWEHWGLSHLQSNGLRFVLSYLSYPDLLTLTGIDHKRKMITIRTWGCQFPNFVISLEGYLILPPPNVWLVLLSMKLSHFSLTI